MKNPFYAVGILLLLTLTGASVAKDDAVLPPSKDTMNTINLSIQAHDKAKPVEQSWHLLKNEALSLQNSQINDKILLKGFPNAIKDSKSDPNKTNKQQIELTRYNIMAPGAKITLINAQGEQNITHPDLMAFSAPEYGVGLILDPRTGDVNGILNQSGITMTISGNTQTGLDLRRNDEGMPTNQTSQQCLTAMADQPSNLLADLKTDMMSKSLAINNRGAIDYEAIIAVDTDNEWMAGKSNNPAIALSYITSLFVNMNVFYERDLSLRLLIGNVTFRTTTDPYPNRPNAFDSLNDFGEYWRVNNDHISRDFVVLLSGQNIGNLSFSGIAWINQYCQNGFLQAGGTQTVGSYSVNRIGSSLNTGFTAQFLAHEIGHNMGSPHTHCYLPAVDECYNAEDGCFAGSVSCPAGGSGTIMSYCHFGAPDGADCGLNDEEFHPTVINLLDARITSNFPACIQPLGSDVIFENGFE